MEQILFDILLGSFVGFLIGLQIMLFTRDGVWPDIWVFLILIGGAVGVLLGLMNYFLGHADTLGGVL